MFSKPRIMSIILLLAILVISLMLSSYENFEGAIPDAVLIVNKEAPTTSATSATSTKATSATSTKATSDLTPNAIVLGGGNNSNKFLTVSDITSTLQQNPSVQQMLTKLPVKQ